MARLAQSAAAELDLLLADADRALARGYPGDRPGRQPVHTAYVPADRFGGDLPGQWGAQAPQALQRTVPRATDIAAVPRGTTWRPPTGGSRWRSRTPTPASTTSPTP